MTDTATAGNSKAGSFLDIGILLLMLILSAYIVFLTLNYINERAAVFGGKSEHFVHIDFINTYMMSKLALSSQSHFVYDPEVQRKFYNATIAPHQVETFCFCQYPPFYFPLFAPLTAFTLKQAYLLWNAFSVALGALSLYLVNRARKEGLSNVAMMTLIAMSIASFPSCDAVLNGEITWFFVALFAVFTYFLLRNQLALAGLPFGLLSLKPHFFVVLGIPSLFTRKPPVFLSAAAVIAALVALASYFVGFENVINYPHILLHAESTEITGNLFPERMICLRGPLSIFAPRDLALHMSFAGFVVGLALMVFLWYSALVKDRLSREWAMALTIFTMLITSPHLHVYDAVLVYLAAALTLPDIRLSRLFKVPDLSYRIWCLLLFGYWLISWLFMSLAPAAGAAVLPARIQTMLAVNGMNCGLLGFYCILALHIVLLALGLRCAFRLKSN